MLKNNFWSKSNNTLYAKMIEMLPYNKAKEHKILIFVPIIKIAIQA